MKILKIKKVGASIQKSIQGNLRHIMTESEFWKKVALQQQVILHAKYQT